MDSAADAGRVRDEDVAGACFVLDLDPEAAALLRALPLAGDGLAADPDRPAALCLAATLAADTCFVSRFGRSDLREALPEEGVGVDLVAAGAVVGR